MTYDFSVLGYEVLKVSKLAEGCTLRVLVFNCGRFSCVTKDVIYCIECGKCGDIYIGETERRLGDRIREHLRDIKTKNRNKEVAIHFNSPGHSLENFKVQILYENLKDNLARKMRVTSS